MITGVDDRNKSELIAQLEKIHTTELGVERIRRNLSMEVNDVVQVCKEMIQSPHSIVTQRGKNWYVVINDCEITVNRHSFTIITAHKLKKRRSDTL